MIAKSVILNSLPPITSLSSWDGLLKTFGFNFLSCKMEMLLILHSLHCTGLFSGSYEKIRENILKAKKYYARYAHGKLKKGIANSNLRL